jgi:G3E family GTPase
VFNKWEGVSERRFDDCLDMLGDLEGVQVAWVKSDKGKVPLDLVFGIDESLARGLSEEEANGHDHDHDHKHEHGVNGHRHEKKGHQSEVEVLSITLKSEDVTKHGSVDTKKLEKLLKDAPKDEVYRISQYSIW